MSRLLPLATIALLAAACSSAPSTSGEPATKSAKSAIIKGTASTDAQDAVVLIVHYDPSSSAGVGSCTGSLIAPNLVLTARHCVANTDEAAACKADGTPIAGGVVRGNHKPDSLYIFTGTTRPNFYGGSIHWDGQGAQILDDGGKSLCSHDIALIVLKAPINNGKILPMRLDADVTKGEKFTAVGWGVTDKTAEPNNRMQRTGVSVQAIGPDTSQIQDVPMNEFEVGEAICSGDSGGPAISEDTGAILGVVSRGGNGSQGSQSDPSAGCIGADNLYTRIGAFKDFILNGFEVAQAEPWLEGGPDPRLLKPGSACDDGSMCRSNLCVLDLADKSQSICADDCSAADCPEGMTCHTEGDAKVCRDPEVLKNAASTTTTSGCATSPSSNANGGLVGFALAALGVLTLRRRRAA